MKKVTHATGAVKPSRSTYSPQHAITKEENVFLEKESKRAQHLGVRLVHISYPGYPQQLKEIPSAPRILYVKGHLPSDPRYISIIGTRKPSNWSLKATEELAIFLAKKDFSVVSGLALGIDTHAHKTALEAHGHTVAVLPCGLDQIYPRQNHHLAHRILTSGGALISEQPFGASLSPDSFIQRNRLISGLSGSTVFAQGLLKSGSMHTARFCLLQQRKLFAFPPPFSHTHQPQSQCNIALLQRSGPQLAQLLNTRGEYQEFLKNKFPQSPVATPLGDPKMLIGTNRQIGRSQAEHSSA